MDKIEKISVNGQVYELAGSGGGSGTPINITYNELVSLKNSSSLMAGAKYRITDYTAVFKTLKSAGHQFDIVVEAMSESSLSEKASAMRHEGDDYFANSKLESWEIWYSLDNDTTRFYEASENGKGFIYKIKDEYGNDVCFDFKNALFTLSSDEYPFITENPGSMDFYLFSVNTGTASDISNQDAIKDRSVLYPNTVMNNTVNFRLTNSYCTVFFFDKYLLGSLEKIRILSGNVLLNNNFVFAFSKNATNIYNIKSSHSIKTKWWSIVSDIEFYNDIVIDRQNNVDYFSLSECKISGIKELSIGTTGTIHDVDISISGLESGLIIQQTIEGCIVRLEADKRDITYTIEKYGDGTILRDKLIWGKFENEATIVKVIDPFDLVS